MNLTYLKCVFPLNEPFCFTQKTCCSPRVGYAHIHQPVALTQGGKPLYLNVQSVFMSIEAKQHMLFVCAQGTFR